MRNFSLSDPLIAEMAAGRPIVWENDRVGQEAQFPVSLQDVHEARARMERFAPLLQHLFADTQATQGRIESPLRTIEQMQKVLGAHGGTLLLKCDSHLPISGSIKARGGVHEVLKYAETLAQSVGLLQSGDNYLKLAEPQARDFFKQHSLAVGSTGNLGLTIGLMGTALGFSVTVHMSADARTWKKQMLRSKGAQVIEYSRDYTSAVEAGRRQAMGDPSCHFVDDENSADLFLGYATAAFAIEEQLREMGHKIGPECPLFVYLPCGVGGGPGGVTYGLKALFGADVHCFFVEPTQAPCMTLGMISGMHNGISVQEIGLSGKTAADGLAIGRPSAFVGKMMTTLIDGCMTVEDDRLFLMMAHLADQEDIWLEPSAAIGFSGYEMAMQQLHFPAQRQGVHIVWATGGSLVPREQMEQDYALGRSMRGK